MKSRKTKVFVVLGLAAISGFLLMATSFAADTKEIKLDAKNAVQIIPHIIFRSTVGDTSNEVDLENVANKQLIRIDTKSKNFVIYRQGNMPHVDGSNSAILGGDSNQIYGSSDNSVIIAGQGNTITSAAGATIGGGQGNTVSSNYGTVAGGQGNTASNYGTVAGGQGNTAAGAYSVALGNGTAANGENSVAMGTNATVDADNSFLWSDSTATLSSSDTFAVVGGSGMVVNETKAHRFAQLTIGGSLLLNEGAKDTEVQCGAGKGKGIVKVVPNDEATDQICFCSCDGKSWHSLFGAGNCNQICGNTPAPQCGTKPENLVKKCDETKTPKQFVFSGTCDIGEVVEGTGAYFVDRNEEVHWTCQTNDGRWKDCHSAVKKVYTGNCSEPAVRGKCSGSYADNGALLLEGSEDGFNGIKDATLYPNRAAALGNKCAWYCPDGTEKQGEICRDRNGCPADMINDYSYGYLNDGAQTGVVKIVAGQTCRNTVVCSDGIASLLLLNDDCTANSCQGSYPEGATLSTATPADNTTSWSCSTSTTQACTYTCPSGKVCDGTNGCRTERHGSCDLSEPYGCGEDGNTVNKTDTTDSTEWEWYCKGADDIGDGAYCHKSCPDGKHIKWNGTHNGMCVDDVKVRFKVNNNSSSSVDVLEVEVGSPWDNTAVEFKNNGGTLGQTVGAYSSVTSDYSTYDFVEGQSYYMRLVHDKVGNCLSNQTSCEFIYGTFTPYAGENLFVFNIAEPDPEIHNYRISWSYTADSEILTYTLSVKNLDTNRVENLPIDVGLASHYTINARSGGVPASTSTDGVYLGENGGNNGIYVSTVNIPTYASNGISNPHLTSTAGAVSWQEHRGNHYYNIELVQVGSQPAVCGSAARSASSEKPTSELCVLGAASSVDPVSTYGGNNDGWSWTCNNGGPDVTCTACNMYKTVYDKDHHEVILTMEYSATYGACVAYEYNGSTATTWTTCTNPGALASFGSLSCRTDWVRFRNGLRCDTFMSSAEWQSRSNLECGVGGGYFDQGICGCGTTTYHCNAGTYLKKNETTCSPCPCGYYCEGGDFSKSETADQGKSECGPGKWSSAGATNYGSCSNISCGYYGINACSATPSGQKCASDKYSTAGSSTCSSCPSGQQPNSTQCSCETTTYHCNAGTYLKKNETTCSPCPCGYYCGGGNFPKSTTTDQGKTSCPSGKYSEAGSSACSTCPDGKQPDSTQCSCETTTYHCNAGTYLKKNATTCSQCPCGYYCPGGEWSKSTTEDQGKSECGPGKRSNAGATSSSSCGNINCGYYGTNACSATPSGQKCASNKYSEAGSSSCNSCPSGKVPNSTQCSCRSEEHGECDYTKPYYGCGEGNTLNKVDTTSSTEWQWYCKGEDDTDDGAYCHKGCPSGQTLNWNGLHDGECLPDTQEVDCGGSIPQHASAKPGHGTFTQTWDGYDWAPVSVSWTYGASTCGFECDTNYTWHSNEKICCGPEDIVVNGECRGVDHYKWIYKNAINGREVTSLSQSFYANGDSRNSNSDGDRIGARVYAAYFTRNDNAQYCDSISRSETREWFPDLFTIYAHTLGWNPGFHLSLSKCESVYTSRYKDEDNFSFFSPSNYSWHYGFDQNGWWWWNVSGESSIRSVDGGNASYGNGHWNGNRFASVSYGLNESRLTFTTGRPSVSVSYTPGNNSNDIINLSLGAASTNTYNASSYNGVYTEDNPLRLYGNVVWGGVFSKKRNNRGDVEAYVADSHVWTIDAYVKPYYYKECPSGYYTSPWWGIKYYLPASEGETELLPKETYGGCDFIAEVYCNGDTGEWEFTGEYPDDDECEVCLDDEECCRDDDGHIVECCYDEWGYQYNCY